MSKKSKRKQIYKPYRNVTEVMTAGRYQSPEQRRENGISDLQYNNCMKNPAVCGELSSRMESAQLHGQAILVGGAAAAAGMLIKLIEQGKGETTRKACVDVIKLSQEIMRERKAGQEADPNCGIELSDYKAGRLIEALAEDEPEEG